MPDRIRARWKGGFAGIIPGAGITLSDGDEMLIYPHEAYGQTWWVDPHNQNDWTLIGIGHICKEEDAGKKKPELEAMGYRFDEPSRNWEALDSFVPGGYPLVSPPQEVDLSQFYVPPPEPEPLPADAPTIITEVPPPAQADDQATPEEPPAAGLSAE